MFYKVLDFITEFYEAKGSFESFLDVGSRNINGTVKEAILRSNKTLPKKIIGVDMIPGDNVDFVLNGHNLTDKFEKESFDLITCCETFEHDNKFWLTLEQMKKILKLGGYLLITVPGLYFIEHNYPSDYYRFTKSVLEEVFFEGMTDVYVEEFKDIHDPTPGKPNNSLLGYAKKI